jgi:putative phage-type endonuclease
MNANVMVSTTDMKYQEWLEYRRKGIGGSDVAAVCGLSKWKSPVEVWLDKTGQIEPEPAGEAAYWGTLMEPVIREEFTDRTGLRVRQVNALLQHKRFPFMLANIDGIVNAPPVVRASSKPKHPVLIGRQNGRRVCQMNMLCRFSIICQSQGLIMPI